MAVVETDVVTPLRPPYAIAAKLVAQHARFMWMREGLRLVETEIAHVAALGEDHDILRSAIGKCDVRDGIAVSRSIALTGRTRPEGGEKEFAPRAARNEIAIIAKADRPHRIAPVIAGLGPVGTVKRIAAPHRIVKAHPAACILPH